MIFFQELHTCIYNQWSSSRKCSHLDSRWTIFFPLQTQQQIMPQSHRASNLYYLHLCRYHSYMCFGGNWLMSNFVRVLLILCTGARVLQHLSSDTYWPHKHIDLPWNIICFWRYSSETQRKVIQVGFIHQIQKMLCFMLSFKV